MTDSEVEAEPVGLTDSVVVTDALKLMEGVTEADIESVDVTLALIVELQLEELEVVAVRVLEGVALALYVDDAE